MKRILVAVVVVMALTAACGGGDESAYEDEMAAGDIIVEPPPSSPRAMKATQEALSPAGVPRSQPAPPSTGEPGAEQYIAYSHTLGLLLPKGQVERLMAVHAGACHAAGTATCIVINSNLHSQDENYASGQLSIRATPDWIEDFMRTVARETDELGGEIVGRSTRADDLTRQIIDTGARLDAQETLQGRLHGLLERRDGTLGDLLKIERELARVTGEIESIKAQLKTLRMRVSMSSLDLNYQTKVPPFSGSRDNPLSVAFEDFFYNFSGAIASVVTAFAFGLPWIVLIAVLLWVWLKLIRPRLGGKKAA
jgi:hypothetical protein